jgi:hypothetical protein
VLANSPLAVRLRVIVQLLQVQNRDARPFYLRFPATADATAVPILSTAHGVSLQLFGMVKTGYSANFFLLI